MIDIHSHILPGLDDGAPDVRTAIKMARVAVKDGVTGVVATPHCYDGVHNCQKDQILAACTRFNRVLQKAKVDLTVYPGAEVRLIPELIQEYDNGDLLTLGDAGKAILLELPEKFIPDSLNLTVKRFNERGVKVIIAHPERNWTILNNMKTADVLFNSGVCIQLTGNSLLGKFGRRVKIAAIHFIERGSNIFIASDSHNLTSRSPKLKKAVKRFRALRGEEFEQNMTTQVLNFVDNSFMLNINVNR